MSFSRVIVRLKHQRAIEGEKRNCVIDRRTRDVVDALFFSPQHIRSSHQYCNFPIPLPQQSSDYSILMRGTNPADISHFSTLTTPPLPNTPLTQPTRPTPRSLHSQTDLPVWVNVLTRARDLKRKKKKSSEFFEEEWWKKKWGKRRAKCDREDWFKENNRENVHTHTHSSDCVGTFCINCVRHETEGESVRVWEKRGD